MERPLPTLFAALALSALLLPACGGEQTVVALGESCGGDRVCGEGATCKNSVCQKASQPKDSGWTEADAGEDLPDAGLPDAGTALPDAGLPDAEVLPEDAGLPSADASTGGSDAGKPDAGPKPVDAGVYLDAGPAVPAKQASAGDHFSCAVTMANSVKCWGENADGQLGDGTVTRRTIPTAVTGLNATVTSVVAGYRHACAITSAGGLKCWGRNEYGQLGDGTTTSRATAADVLGLTSGVAGVAVGSRHTCAVTTGGAVKCWGLNDVGQLGDGTTKNKNSPTDVTGLSSGATAVATGMHFSCALLGTGGIKCWGTNGSGSLGDGTTTFRTSPVDVSGISAATALTAGSAHACAIVSGGAKCWGDNLYGQIGDGTTLDRKTPVEVSGLGSDVAAIAASTNTHTCALTNSGRAKCWGLNGSGQLGDGTKVTRKTPVDVANMTTSVVSISAGGLHTLAVLDSGIVQAWGANDTGQLGDGTNTSRTTPADVPGL